jgi:hypothetical protein
VITLKTLLLAATVLSLSASGAHARGQTRDVIDKRQAAIQTMVQAKLAVNDGAVRAVAGCLASAGYREPRGLAAWADSTGLVIACSSSPNCSAVRWLCAYSELSYFKVSVAELRRGGFAVFAHDGTHRLLDTKDSSGSEHVSSFVRHAEFDQFDVTEAAMDALKPLVAQLRSEKELASVKKQNAEMLRESERLRGILR